MSILNMMYPNKQAMPAIIVETENGDDWSAVLQQKFDEVQLREWGVTKKHTLLLCAPMGLDIETTTTTTADDSKAAFMYHWQLSFGDYQITGRKWDTLFEILEAIEEAYSLGSWKVGKGKRTAHWERTVICWIANAGYEFQFMCRRKWHNKSIVKDGTFASSMRNPLKTVLGFSKTSTKGITVYDALQFSTSLKQLAKDYCVTQKASGDLDFSIPRNSKTPLNTTEKGYCFNDTITLDEWARYYLDCYVRQEHFAPMTSTAIIREAVMQEYTNAASMDMHLNTRTLALHPTLGEYHRAIWHLYRGGFTYASRTNAGKIWDDVTGRDFTSSYPAVMLQEKFPSTPFTPSKASTVDELNALTAQGKAWYADIRFKNLIQTKEISVENCMKLHEWNGSGKRLYETTGAIIDNGKLVYARECTVTLQEHDWETYNEYYEWDDDIEIRDVMVADKDYLPEWFRKIVMHFYEKKASLKAAGKDDTIEYTLSKAIVNGLYGLTVQKIHFDEIEFSTETGCWKTKRLHYNDSEERVKMGDKYEKELGRDPKTLAKRGGVPKTVLSPYYGIWITAIARRRILQAIGELGSDFIYCDTDSVYYKNEAAHQKYFDEWNNKVYSFNDTNLKKPEFHTLGDFDPVALKKADKTSVTHYSFLTLGAKRYIKWDGADIKPTIAGLPHGAMDRAAESALKEEDKEATPMAKRDWIVSHFADGLKIGINDALKNAHFYIDTPVDADVTDVNGVTEKMHEESSIVIYPIEFTLKLNPEYADVMGMRAEEILLMKAMKQYEEQRGRF